MSLPAAFLAAVDHFKNNYWPKKLIISCFYY